MLLYKGLDFVPHLPEDFDSFICVRYGSGIEKILVDVSPGARENRTGFFGAVADGDYVIEPGADKFAGRFGTVPGNVDADFGQRLYRLRSDRSGGCPGTEGQVMTGIEVVEQALGHLGAGGIVGTDEQYLLFNFVCVHIAAVSLDHSMLNFQKKYR